MAVAATRRTDQSTRHFTDWAAPIERECAAAGYGYRDTHCLQHLASRPASRARQGGKGLHPQPPPKSTIMSRLDRWLRPLVGKPRVILSPPVATRRRPLATAKPAEALAKSSNVANVATFSE